MSAVARFHGFALGAAGPEHLAAVGRDLRPSDRQEAEALERLTGGGLSVVERLDRSFAGSDCRYALVHEATGETLAVGGVVPLEKEAPTSGILPWGSPWMVGTPALDAVPRAAARCLRLMLPLQRERFSGLANFILEKEGDGRNGRFLRRLGFTLRPVAFPAAESNVGDGNARLFFIHFKRAITSEKALKGGPPCA